MLRQALRLVLDGAAGGHPVAGRQRLLLGRPSKPDAVRVLSAAADEDRTGKSIVTPGPLAPARELFGALTLTERGRARDARAVFETALVKEPNRYNGLEPRRQSRRGAGRQGEGQYDDEKLVRSVTGQQGQLARAGHGPSLPTGYEPEVPRRT